MLLARADELEALLRLSLGDLRSAGELASRLPPARCGLLLARIALASGDHHAAQKHLQAAPLADLTPRRALVRQILLAAAAIDRSDPAAPAIVAGVLGVARREGFLNTVVTTAPELTSYLVEHTTQVRPDPFTERLIAAALQVRAAQPDAHLSGRGLADPLTAGELRVLELLPTSTYLQIAAALYISYNTVKTHLRSIYQKLGVTSRSQAIERAVDLRLLLRSLCCEVRSNHPQNDDDIFGRRQAPTGARPSPCTHTCKRPFCYRQPLQPDLDDWRPARQYAALRPMREW